MAEQLTARLDENAAARADEREALTAIFDGVSLDDERVEAPLDLDAPNSTGLQTAITTSSANQLGR